jgi:membrane fusion protein (multidrug efflux system)
MTPQSLRWLSPWLVVAALGAAGCKRQPKTDTKPTTVSVEVMKVAPGSIARVLAYDADIQGELEVKVFAQVAERIISLPVEEGMAVKRGQTLAILRADGLSEGVRSAAAAVDAARADRDNLKEELARAEKLAARHIVARAQVDQLRLRVASAEAQIRRLEAMTGQARTARSHAVVRSPITGVVGRRYLSLGDLAVPTLPILTVVRMDRVELTVEVPEQELADVREGTAVGVRVARYGDRVFPGKVVLIAPTIDRQTRTARVKVRVDNPKHELMPGMLARVTIEVERHEGVLVVPYSSLIIETAPGGGLAYRAFVADGTTARERLVTLGIVDGPRVEVRAGLKAGELLITKGQHLLDQGRTIEIVERRGAAGTPLGPASASAPAPAAAREPPARAAR